MSNKKTQVGQRKSLLAGASALAAATAMFSAAPISVAVAQEAEDDEAIVVTGTRIARRDAVAESPILTVGQEEMTNSGYVTVEQYLNTLPQFTANISSQSNNPSSNGRAFVDLRGLGANRNLVLLDGRRPMGQSGGGTIVDVNTIPVALVERTEIITGGAASTYGADAISGVVNFILRDNFEGFQADTHYRLTEQGDGEEWGADFTLGGNFADGRGNAVFNASYFSRDAMYKGARSFSGQASTATPIFPGGSWEVGPNTPSPAGVQALFGPGTGTGGACNVNGGDSGFGFNPDGTLFCTGVGNGNALNVVGYTGPQGDIATRFFPDVFSYNFEPDNILVLPMERWNFFSRVSLDLNQYFRPYIQASFTNYNALQELAPTPAGQTTGFTIPTTNPTIPTQLANLAATRTNATAPIAIAKRFNALGGRTGFNSHDVWQVVLGTEGDLTDTWTYDVYASYGRSVLTEFQGGNVRRDRVQNLLNATDGGAALSGCGVPLNLFGSAVINDCMAAYIGLEAKNLTIVDQTVVEGTVTGDLFSLPAGEVQVALGASYREIAFDFRPDSGLQPGLVAGFNQQLPVNGELDWFDIFGEVYVPLLANLPLVDSLSITAGYRTTENSQSGQAESWKITGDWTVSDWLRFRGGVQQAIRSPNIQELFAPILNNFPTFTAQDPCNTSGANASNALFGRNGANGANVQALCAAQSAVAGGASYNQPGSQATGITGGNPNLSPETADSYTIGFVLNSPFETGPVQNLYLSVDYWSFELEQQIGAFGASLIVQRCFNRDNANPTYSSTNSWCQLFTRSQTSGGVIDLAQTNNNDSTTLTSGVDIAAGFGLDLGGLGSLDLGWVSTWTESYESGTTVSAADPLYEYAGTIGSTTGSAVPEWRHTFTTTWTNDSLTLAAQARYIDAMVHSNTLTGGSPLSNTGVPEIWYYDLRGSLDLTSTLTLRAGVNNVTDEQPPLYSPNVQSNTDPSTYDVLGRRFFVGLNLRL